MCVDCIPSPVCMLMCLNKDPNNVSLLYPLTCLYADVSEQGSNNVC